MFGRRNHKNRFARRYQRRFPGIFPWTLERIHDCVHWIVEHPRPILTVAVSGGLVWGVVFSAQRLEAFRITRVDMPEEVALTMPRALIGRNIWKVNISALAAALHAQQPSLKVLRVIRQLPNVIQVEAIVRVPVAQLKVAYKWFPVDEEGYILPQSAQKPHAALSRLAGVEHKAGSLRVGQVNKTEPLVQALRVLDSLQKDKVLEKHQLTFLDVTNPKQIKFLMNDETEVRCGSEDQLPENLNRLRETLKIVDSKEMSVRYIDVRFQEPVIGPS